MEEPGDGVEVNVVFPPTGLMHNSKCTKFFKNLVDCAFDAPVSGSATLHKIPDLAVDATGKQVGAFGTIRLLLPKHVT